MTDLPKIATAHPGGYEDIVAFIREKGSKTKVAKLEEILNMPLGSGLLAAHIQGLLVDMHYSDCLPSRGNSWQKPCSTWKKDKPKKGEEETAEE